MSLWFPCRLASVAACIVFGASANADVVECRLVPKPAEFVVKSGTYVARTDDPVAVQAEEIDDRSIPAEGYRLSVTTSGIRIASSGSAGAFYARQTLGQLADAEGEGKDRSFRYPCIEIVDAPRYRWRGLLLDEGRNFFGKSAVKRLLDRMAEHKLNVFHWHLTEDQGWRLDLEGFPELVRYGAVRRESPIRECRGVPEDFKGDGVAYGPFFYTEEDIREIVAYAKARHVTVVPEIEIPGHVRALLAAHPEFSCRGNIDRSPRVCNGVEEDVLCAGNDAALEYVERVYDAVVRLFGGAYFHLGGDECPRTRWKACAKCQARMKSLGLKDERLLQGWMTRRFTDFLSRRGLRAIGWDEVLEGNVPTQTVVQCWQDAAKIAGAAALGHEVIASPLHFTYFSCPQGLKEDPFVYLSPNLFVPLEKAYSFDPCRGVAEQDRHRVIGGECCLWSERIFNEDDLAWKTWPRACAFAESVWSGERGKDFAGFCSRLRRHREWLIRRHVNCAPLE